MWWRTHLSSSAAGPHSPQENVPPQHAGAPWPGFIPHEPCQWPQLSGPEENLAPKQTPRDTSSRWPLPIWLSSKWGAEPFRVLKTGITQINSEDESCDSQRHQEARRYLGPEWTSWVRWSCERAGGTAEDPGLWRQKEPQAEADSLFQGLVSLRPSYMVVTCMYCIF